MDKNGGQELIGHREPSLPIYFGSNIKVRSANRSRLVLPIWVEGLGSDLGALEVSALPFCPADFFKSHIFGIKKKNVRN